MPGIEPVVVNGGAVVRFAGVVGKGGLGVEEERDRDKVALENENYTYFGTNHYYKNDF